MKLVKHNSNEMYVCSTFLVRPDSGAPEVCTFPQNVYPGKQIHVVSQTSSKEFM